ncbi:hypothetical protein [Galbitalea soli]|uniref:DUF1508 domain-containing protein n=1 Tax=Galbitalea soli TaxID=1268042 RepID=A0A7C9PNH0_9MICO|nr:hypothetical protein [Galbitalea soli]NEM91408.1 hypothetical protein [Galbitalea soli]NYJ30101.1 hypothetical protein [Galbitalea soli]
MVTMTELFFLVDAGEGRWYVRHQLTDEPAGSILRTSRGYALMNTEKRPLGTYDTIADALRSLYATV